MTRITKLMGLDQLKETDPDLMVCENQQPRECSKCKKSTHQLKMTYQPVALRAIGASVRVVEKE